MFSWARSLAESAWIACHCETPVYAAEGQIFILRTLVWGTRGVKGKAHCAVSVGSHPCAKNAQEWGTLGADCAGEIKSLGQAPKFLGYPVRLESCCASCCGRGRLPSFARLGPFDFAQGRLAMRPSPHEPVHHATLAHRLSDFSGPFDA